MAVAARRRRFDSGGAYWPGFVDAMATLLLVIIFLLSVFMLAQYLLAREISGRDTALTQLRTQLAELTDLLALERASTRSLQASLAGLSDDLASAEAERIRLAGLVGELEGSNRALEREMLVLQDRLNEEETGRLSALAELERQQQVIVDLRTVAERDTARIAGLTEDLRSEQDARTAAETLAASREAVIVDLRSEAEKSAIDLAALTAAIDTERSTSSDLTAELEQERLLVVDLRSQIDQGQTEAADIRAALESEEAARARLADALAARSSEADDAREATAQRDRRLVVLADEVSQARAQRQDALASLATSQERLIVLQDEQQKQLQALNENIALLTARAEDAEEKLVTETSDADSQRQIVIDLRRERDRGAALLSTAEGARDEALEDVALLSRQLRELQRQLASLQEALNASEARDATQRTQIADLGRRLNIALAQKVKELSRYRSEFFGRLREILSDRSDIQVVGDRFVFQSEVLFPPASATLDQAGREEMAKLGEALVELEREIPDEINWVLRVDGHTDKRPIATAIYRSNWELSSSRAISVVQSLIAAGVDPRRLVAAGFGEFQPLNDADLDDVEGLRRNRRIELKLTER